MTPPETLGSYVNAGLLGWRPDEWGNLSATLRGEGGICGLSYGAQHVAKTNLTSAKITRTTRSFVARSAATKSGRLPN